MKGLLMIFFISMVLINAHEKCPFKEKFITKDKINIFEDEHNRIRNDVALARIKNPEGQFQTAANMYNVQYDKDLADKAQDCADRCPKSNRGCHGIDLASGVLVWEGKVWNGGFDWFPKQVMREWMDDPESARQMVWGTVTKFGCGRIQSQIKSQLREVVVCFYDQKTKSHGPPYKYGPVISKCTYGRQPGFLGLCNNGRRSFIHQALHISGHTQKKGDLKNKKTKKSQSSKKNTKKTEEIQETS